MPIAVEQRIAMLRMDSVGDFYFVDLRGIRDFVEAVKAKAVLEQGMAATDFIVWMSILGNGKAEANRFNRRAVLLQEQVEVGLCSKHKVLVHERILLLERNLFDNGSECHGDLDG